MKDFLHNIYTSFLPILLLFITFIQPIYFILVSVGMFIVIDIAFAYWRVRKNPEEKWNWLIMILQFIPKFFVYQMLILGVFTVDFGLVNEFTHIFSSIDFFLTKLMSMVLIFVELKSIDKSFKVIKGNSLFSYLFNLISFFRNVKDKLTEVNNNKNKTEE